MLHCGKKEKKFNGAVEKILCFIWLAAVNVAIKLFHRNVSISSFIRNLGQHHIVMEVVPEPNHTVAVLLACTNKKLQDALFKNKFMYYCLKLGRDVTGQNYNAQHSRLGNRLRAGEA